MSGTDPFLNPLSAPQEFPPAFQTRPLVKICGITRVEDAALAHSLGASFIGLILTSRSPRRIKEVAALRLIGELQQASKGAYRFIGVFVDEPAEEIARMAAHLQLFAVQVHSFVPGLTELMHPDRIIPAMAIRDEERVQHLAGLLRRHEAVLTDAYADNQHGGTGKVFDHRLVQPLFDLGKVFLAGGLSPETIGPSIAKLRPGRLPYCFDLSSGVEESPGIKSQEKLQEFFRIYYATLAQ